MKVIHSMQFNLLFCTFFFSRTLFFWEYIFCAFTKIFKWCNLWRYSDQSNSFFLLVTNKTVNNMFLMLYLKKWCLQKPPASFYSIIWATNPQYFITFSLWRFSFCYCLALRGKHLERIEWRCIIWPWPDHFI